MADPYRTYGYNPRSTPFKQFALDKAAAHLISSSVAVTAKIGAPCVVIGDMTAGPGRDPNGKDGSPLIFARHMDTWREQGRDVELRCTERNAAALDQLRSIMTERFPALHVRFFRSQAEALATIPRDAVGLTYWDPTRYNDLDRDLLSAFGRSHRLMDILITRECLASYRMQRADHCPDTLTIQDYLALTGKKRNYLMPYAKHGWWTFGFADNWTTRPAYKLRGFVNVESERGKQLYRKWTADLVDEGEERIEEKSLWSA